MLVRRPSETASVSFQCCHVTVGERTGPDRVFSQNLFQGNDLWFRDEHTRLTVRTGTVTVSLGMVRHWFHPNGEFKSERCVASFGPCPKGLHADRTDHQGGLTDIVIAMALLIDVGRWFHSGSLPVFSRKITKIYVEVSDMALPGHDAHEAAGVFTETPVASANGTDRLPLVLNQVSEPDVSSGEEWKNDGTGVSWG